MHSLLQRQFRKYLGISNDFELAEFVKKLDPSIQKNFSNLIKSVESTYQDVDRNTFITNRSVELSTQELTESNEALRNEMKKNQQIIHKLIEAAQILSEDNSNFFQNLDATELVKKITNLAEENKKIQEQYKLAKVDSEKANAAKSEFLANMSHEIRTPLNAVIGFTELLMKSEMTPEQQQYMKIVFRSANSLLDLLNDILDFSKIEAGKLELEITKSNIFDIISQSTDLINIKAQSKGLEVLIYINPNVPKYIWTDFIRLRQIIVNLLSNALKFTEKGYIEIKIDRITQNESKDKVELIFSISDTGIGISEENLERIFHAFSQEDSSITRKFGGTGLGLSISNQLLKLMNSRLNVKSKVKEGSAFYFNLELKSESEELVDQNIVSFFKNVLIVSSTNNKNVLQSILSTHGAKTTIASTGESAIEILKSNSNFSLLILDYLLSDIDGLEVISMIRNKINLSSAQLPILLCHTTFDAKRIFDTLNKQDIQGTLLKPILFPQLLTAIAEIKPKELVVNSPVETLDLENIKLSNTSFSVLVADDTPLNIFLVKVIMEQFFPKARIIEATNGKEAVSKYKSENPDLIFMDIQMPEMNGYEATLEIRKIDTTNQTPIIALTAGTVQGEIEKCLEVGMNDYASKPISNDKIKKLVQKWLKINSNIK